MDENKLIVDYKETIAYRCRWSEYVEEIIGNNSIIWEDSSDDYQGHARVLSYKDNQFIYIEWYYGSCSGCDEYEGMGEDDIRKAFKENLTMVFKEPQFFINWMKALQNTKDFKFNSICEKINKNCNISFKEWGNDFKLLISKINTHVLLK